ncbi:hypothetical protein D3C84_1319870 [compost metagenome]
MMAKKKFSQSNMSDGRDIEFSRELADQDDLEAMERSKAADERMKSKPPMKNK